MTKKTLTVKNMIKTYFDSNIDSGMWEAFLFLRYYGFITEDEWKKFFETCKGWTWDFERSLVIDTNTDEPVKL